MAKVEKIAGAKRSKESGVSDDTLADQHRKSEAGRANRKGPPIKETYYFLKTGLTHNPKKGRKLIRVTVTENGATTDYIGFEKKLPAGFIKKLIAKGELRHEDQETIIKG